MALTEHDVAARLGGAASAASAAAFSVFCVAAPSMLENARLEAAGHGRRGAQAREQHVRRLGVWWGDRTERQRQTLGVLAVEDLLE